MALTASRSSWPSRLFLYALILSLVLATLTLVPAPRFAGASETTWAHMSPATSPAALYGASMAYDPATSQMVLFGGDGSGGYLNQTWTWNGTTWMQMSPATSPPARWDASMAYDTANRKVGPLRRLRQRRRLHERHLDLERHYLGTVVPGH